jgi:penicillin amidase
MKALGRILSTLGLVLLALTLVAAGLGVYTIRRSFPLENGAVRLPGLRAPVEVYRDSYGVPHIYADNAHDLFMAQGYIHAQDRFYQMDFWRHQTAGRLSELYGEDALDADRFLRTMGWLRIAEQEYSEIDSESRVFLDAYAEGINAYISSRSAADLSLEYSILGLNGLSRYHPEPWTPANSLAWAKAMAWDLGGNMDDEIMRAILIEKIGEQKTQEFLPLYPKDHPTILPNPSVGERMLEDLHKQISSVSHLFGGKFEGIGSNSWVLAGSRTTTGMPLLANDPHLGIQMPSIWYEVGLHCRSIDADCPFDVTGFSFAGAPTVIIGHNNRIAWGFTNVGPDVQDLVLEKINPANPDQYEVNGEWQEMVIRTETIKVKGGADETITIRATRHGPLITEVYGLEDFAPHAGLEPGNQYTVALRWTALEPSRTWRAIFNLNRAQNWDEFRTALRDLDVPSQNIVYADVDGNIGYQVPGNIPIRTNGDGLLPVPGWTDEYEWTGYIPFDELPFSFNPPQGYIAAANNAIVDEAYPYLIALDWDPGYRAQRIVEMIEAQPKISIEYIQQIQGDNKNLGAQDILPYLLALSFEDPKLAEAAERLRQWDFQMGMDSQPAAIYMGFFNALLAKTFYDEIPEDYWLQGGARSWVILRTLLAQPNSAWWDNTATPTIETRDDIVRQAFAEGYAALEKRLGADADAWKWGALHTATFVNATLGESGVASIEAMFNRGPFPTAGGTSILNATNWNLARDDWDERDNPYAVTSLPSMRMIVDLGNLDNSLTMHTTGQSGHAYHPHYIDMADPWRHIQYHPMLWSRERIEQQAEARLTLAP